MKVFARGQVRTLKDAEQDAAIANTRLRLVSGAVGDALVEAEANQPGACERIARILRPVREQHLQVVKERQ